MLSEGAEAETAYDEAVDAAGSHPAAGRARPRPAAVRRVAASRGQAGRRPRAAPGRPRDLRRARRRGLRRARSPGAARHRREGPQAAGRTRSTSSPRRRSTSPGWPVTGAPTRRSPPSCSSARARSNGTCARCSGSSASARVASCAKRCRRADGRSPSPDLRRRTTRERARVRPGCDQGALRTPSSHDRCDAQRTRRRDPRRQRHPRRRQPPSGSAVGPRSGSSRRAWRVLTAVLHRAQRPVRDLRATGPPVRDHRHPCLLRLRRGDPGQPAAGGSPVGLVRPPCLARPRVADGTGRDAGVRHLEFAARAVPRPSGHGRRTRRRHRRGHGVPDRPGPAPRGRTDAARPDRGDRRERRRPGDGTAAGGTAGRVRQRRTRGWSTCSSRSCWSSPRWE